MESLTQQQLAEIMNNQDNIRNVSVVSSANHGKSYFIDSLVTQQGISVSEEGGYRVGGYKYFRENSQTELIVKSNTYPLYYKHHENGKTNDHTYFINIIRVPSQNDFSVGFTQFLRVSDGTIVVVDAQQGITILTENLIKSAVQEMIKPILIINKLDKLILELNLDGEAIYQILKSTINSFNVIISTYQHASFGEIQVTPVKGNIAFGSGQGSWAFTIIQLARIYSQKFGTSEDKLINKLWGDNYFDLKNKKWKKYDATEDGTELKRAFVQFIIDPIINFIKALMTGNKEQINKMITSLNLPIKTDEIDYLQGKALLKYAMQKWLSDSDALLEMIVVSLPSPKVAQQYRTQYLYDGPIDDHCAVAMKKCDPEGPLMVYISQMIPTSDNRFFALRRILFGTLFSQQGVRILGNNYVPGKKIDLYIQKLEEIMILHGMRRSVYKINEIPSGNLVAISGADKYLINSGTITTSEDAHIIRSIKYSAIPVIKVAVSPKNHIELPKLIEGLKRLSKSDPLVTCTTEESGLNFISGVGELHIEICLYQLQQEYAQCSINQSEPIIIYKETITSESSQTVLTKSPNKHTRLYGQGIPLTDELSLEIERGKVSPKDDPIIRAQYMCFRQKINVQRQI